MSARGSEVVSMILAAGKSSRMQAEGRAKVCFPLRGKPVIVHALEAYHRAGITRHVVVVGHHAEEVMRTISAGEQGLVLYAFQAQALGTGHAAQCGARLLQHLNYDGAVLVVMGDKVIRPGAVERLMRVFFDQKADLAFMLAEKEVEPDAGRVIFAPDGRPLASIERFDSGRSRLLALYFANTENGGVIPADRALAWAGEFIGPEPKMKLALGELYTELKAGSALDRERLTRHFTPEDRLIRLPNGRKMTGAEVEKSRFVNLSVYLFKASALYYALSHLSRDNAQHEEYLTDTVTILANSGHHKVIAEQVASDDEVLAFNTPAELQRIEQIYSSNDTERQPVSPVGAHPAPDTASQWLEALGKRDVGLLRRLTDIYGPQYSGLAEKIALLEKALHLFQSRFGEGPVLVARAPARVNLMGRHIDHQGGICNPAAIDQELFLVARPRLDRMLRLVNADEALYPAVQIDLEKVVQEMADKSWHDFSRTLPRLPLTAGDGLRQPGHWAYYITGAYLRLQKRFPEQRLHGMDIAVSASVWPAAGLSSSGALVVATMEAIVAANRLPVTREELVSLGEEAEWLVGTRGGAGDHAAILFAHSGEVTPVQFYPFTRAPAIPWPEEAALLIVHSGRKAEKSAEAKHLFNQRVACYRFGLALLLKNHPELSTDVQHLRDLQPERLHMGLLQIYRLLLTLPENMAGSEIARCIPVEWDALMPSTPSPETMLFPIRGTVLYGLAECARSRQFASLLQAHDLARIGRLMYISHNGDRLAVYRDEGIAPFRSHYDDKRLQDLIALAEQGVPAADLALQPGTYGCSTADIDLLVDLARPVEGVYGAQLAGAGLGGSVMILLSPEAIDRCLRRLRIQFFEPRGIEMRAHVCRFVKGSQVLG